MVSRSELERFYLNITDYFSPAATNFLALFISLAKSRNLEIVSVEIEKEDDESAMACVRIHTPTKALLLQVDSAAYFVQTDLKTQVVKTEELSFYQYNQITVFLDWLEEKDPINNENT